MDAPVQAFRRGGLDRQRSVKYVPALVIVVMFAAVVATVLMLRPPRGAAPAVVYVGTAGEPGTERETLPADALFESGRDRLKPGGDRPIRDYAARVKERTGLRVVVIGHTDPRGSVAVNDRLSLARANAVRAVLLDEGLDANRVSAAGVGARILVRPREACSGGDRDPRVVACLESNRRVELWAKTTETAPGVAP